MDKVELEAELEEEKEHSGFLQELLHALYGDGWAQLTIADARELQVNRKKGNECVHPKGYIKSVRICGLCGEQM